MIFTSRKTHTTSAIFSLNSGPRRGAAVGERMDPKSATHRENGGLSEEDKQSAPPLPRTRGLGRGLRYRSHPRQPPDSKPHHRPLPPCGNSLQAPASNQSSGY